MRAITIASLGCLLLGMTAYAAQTPPQQLQAAPAADLPPELAMVPPDAIALIHFQVAKLFAHPVMKRMPPEHLWHLVPAAVQDIVPSELQSKNWGFGITDLSSYTVFMQTTKPGTLDLRGGIILVLQRPYDRQKLLASIPGGTVAKQAGDKTYHVPKDHDRLFRRKFHFIDDKRFMIMIELNFDEDNAQNAELLLAEVYRKKGKGPLTEIIAAAQERVFVFASAYSEEMRKFASQGEQRDEDAWRSPLNKYETSEWTLSLDKVSQMRLCYRFPDTTSAKDAEEGVKHGQKYLLQLLEPPLAEMEDRAKKDKGSDDLAQPALALLLEMQSMLKTAQVRLRDKELTVVLSFRTDDAAIEQVTKFITAWKKTRKDRIW